jgi:hypothetical protein
VRLLGQTNPAEGGAAFALASIGLMAGGALLWLELVVRASLISIFVGVAPLACAAVQWPRLEGVLRQVLLGGLALILSKLVIAIVLSVGFAVLTVDDGLAGLFGGMFIVLIAAISPFAVARVLPVAAEEMSLANQGRLRGWVGTGVGSSVSIVQAAAGLGGGPAVAGRAGGAAGAQAGPGPAAGRRGSSGGTAVAASGAGPSRTGSGPGPQPATAPTAAVRQRRQRDVGQQGG